MVGRTTALQPQQPFFETVAKPLGWARNPDFLAKPHIFFEFGSKSAPGVSWLLGLLLLLLAALGCSWLPFGLLRVVYGCSWLPLTALGPGQLLAALSCSIRLLAIDYKLTAATLRASMVKVLAPPLAPIAPWTHGRGRCTCNRHTTHASVQR